MTNSRSTPRSSIWRALGRDGVRRKGASEGRNRLRGWGSNVRTAKGAPLAFATSAAVPITIRWPRCSPSKLPSATTAPRASSGRSVKCLNSFIPGTPLPPGSRLAQKNKDVYRARALSGKPGQGKRAAVGLSSGAGRNHQHGIAVDHDGITDRNHRLEDDPALFRHDFRHGDPSLDSVTDPHRRLELEVLAQIDAAGTGQPGAENGRDEAGGQNPVGDTALELGRAGEFIVQVDRVGVAGNSSEKDDIGFGHCLGIDGGLTDENVFKEITGQAVVGTTHVIHNLGPLHWLHNKCAPIQKHFAMWHNRIPGEHGRRSINNLLAL